MIRLHALLCYVGMICCCLYVMTPTDALAQELSGIRFTHLGIENGLSQNIVYAITQDKQGNMWFATQNGLNKYDGYDFTVYHHNDDDPHSLADDIVRACLTDRQGRVWAGTDSGLSLYDSASDRFETYSAVTDRERMIGHIIELDDSRLLLYSGRFPPVVIFGKQEPVRVRQANSCLF